MIRDEFGTVSAYILINISVWWACAREQMNFPLYSSEVMKVIQNYVCIIPSVVPPRAMCVVRLGTPCIYEQPR